MLSKRHVDSATGYLIKEAVLINAALFRRAISISHVTSTRNALFQNYMYVSACQYMSKSHLLSSVMQTDNNEPNISIFTCGASP